MTRSAEQRARRAYQERERRAAESPASRQARLALVKAATRRRRQVLTLESDITAKRRNSSIAENQHLRAEHCRQAAVVAEARCARCDATHNDAFEHLVSRMASLMFRLPRSYERSPSLSSQERRRLGCS